MTVTLDDVLARRKVRVVGRFTGELVWINKAGTRVKVRTTDINGFNRFERVHVDDVYVIDGGSLDRDPGYGETND
jgi:hypothetical protein